jgi:hypothetical protein
MTTYKLKSTQESSTVTGAKLVVSSGKSNDISKLVLTYRNRAGDTVTKDCLLSADSCTFSNGTLDIYLNKDQDTLVNVSAYFTKIIDGAESGDAVMAGFKKSVNQFGVFANLTDDFIVLDDSQYMQFGDTDNITLDDSTVTAKTVRKTKVTVAESDASGLSHSTRVQDAVGVFTFTSEAEPGSAQNSTLNSVTVQLSGDLIAADSNQVATVSLYDGATFDAGHLMGTDTITLAAGTSVPKSIALTAHNEWNGAKQVYVVVDTTDLDFVDAPNNDSKLTTQLASFGWADGTGATDINPIVGVLLYGGTYSY